MSLSRWVIYEELLQTPAVSSTDSICAGYCRQKLWGLIFLGWGTWCEAGTPRSQDTPSEFFSTTRGCETGLFSVSAPPTSLDGCDFLNFLLIGLTFNLLSDVLSDGWSIV